MHHSLIIAALASAVMAMPSVQKRAHDPQDQSGNSQIQFKCDSTTLPNPGGSGGQGEGGTGISSSALSLKLPDGTTINPQSGDCVQDSAVSKASFAQLCTLRNDQLDNGSIEVHVLFEDIAGLCSMNFGYKGESFSTTTQKGQITSKCGFTGGGFSPFSVSTTDICFFNA